MTFDANFVVFLSFSAFMIFAFKIGYKKIIATIDAKIEEIRHNLQTAEETRLLRQEEMANEKIHTLEIKEQIDHLLEEAYKKADHLQIAAEKELEDLVHQRHETATKLLERLRIQAVNELKEEVTHFMVEALQHYTKNHLSDFDKQQINDQAIEKIIQFSEQPLEETPKKKTGSSVVKKTLSSKRTGKQ